MASETFAQSGPARLFDTHAHLNDEAFDGQVNVVVQRARTAGLTGIVAIGTTLESSRQCIEIASRHPDVWASVGIHPNYCHMAADDAWEATVKLASAPRVVAIGETGLDRYWDHCPWETQLDFFRRHIELSNHSGHPLVIHMRDCESEMRDALLPFAQKKKLNGIMHSFTGTAEGAAAFLDFGLHISFAGMITYRKSESLRQIAASVPIERLLIETDSPYLSPEPHRSKRPNEPGELIHTARCVAQCRGLTLEQLAEATTANALRLFGLKQVTGSDL